MLTFGVAAGPVPNKKYQRRCVHFCTFAAERNRALRILLLGQ